MRIPALLIGAALAALASPASAQDKTYTLKLSHWVPATHPLQKSMEEWGASVEKASNGTIKYNVYPAQQLGKAADHYDMTRDGIADFSYINPGYQPGRFPIIAAGELPFLVGESHGGIRAVDAWYRKYGPAEMKDVKLCFSFILDPLRMHSRSKKVVVPGDVKGMKIRPAHATMAAWVTQLGGTNISVSPAEIRDTLEKGVADATTTPWGSVLLFGIDKVTKYHLDIPLATTTFQWIMNPKVYESMSASQKKVIDDHCTNDWAAKFADAWADFEAGGADKLRNAPGHEIVSVTPEQLKEWKASGEPVYKSWADAVRKGGGDPDAILKDLRAALDQYKAGF
jgi:TRAP-type C4-dicarboxylate transport system substrate-binding protein